MLPRLTMASVLAGGVAFLSGMVLLGLEIVASRLLAPWFGSSVYVWGSLISVFLLALSIGYAVGGVVADKAPSYRGLAGVLMAASLLVLALPFVSFPVCEWIAARDLDSRAAVLLASAIFFLTPSILMGMVSPYVIRLSASRIESVGRTAGSIYSVSTVGSITGALAVSFYLIPVMGTHAILTLSAGLLLLASALCAVGGRVASGRRGEQR
ncbi:MAG: fused MFS/spermidine synthase [Deferrisomatales bacterium]|nr:fused MFS/spermidine synthase [Deferrisomatales bacterium]